MAVFSVFEPPQRDLDVRDHAAKFVFVRDGFSWPAFLFGPLWMLRHRLWLAFLLYAFVVGGLVYLMNRLRLAEPAEAIVLLMIAILVGLEAGALRRWKLIGKNWIDHGIVVADDLVMAERRFFDRWFAEGAKTPQPALPHPPRPAAVSYASPGIIGSFPEPGGGR